MTDFESPPPAAGSQSESPHCLTGRVGLALAVVEGSPDHRLSCHCEEADRPTWQSSIFHFFREIDDKQTHGC